MTALARTHPRPLIASLLLIMLLLPAACSAPADSLANARADDSIGAAIGSSPTTAAAAATAPSPADLATIILPISIYIIDDEGDELSSLREEREVIRFYEEVNDIWAQAGIVIDIRSVQRLTLPASVVQGIVRGNFRPFLAGQGTGFIIPAPSLINAFYASAIGGPNGVAPFASNLFFVADVPSVPDERVTAHEIGHLLGLHHTLEQPDQLMFPGSNGTVLTNEQVLVARYIAQGLLDRLR